jgi:erythromycin esterase-like protein
VLIGEASHGTHEFYQTRAELTKYLIEERGFNAITIEGDWPDAYDVHHYIHSAYDEEGSEQALRYFKRFPTWMWRNQDVVEFINWLKKHNDSIKEKNHKVGFYGLDLYSLHSSMEAIIQQLEKKDPKVAEYARRRYNCFQHYGMPEDYAYAARLNKSCEQEVHDQLLDIQKQAFHHMSGTGSFSKEEFLYLLQNAKVVKSAEKYYRTLFARDDVYSWNLRDKHMMETLELLAAYYNSLQIPPKIIVWAHNSHIGDARATQMTERGEYNIGQLVKEKYGNEAFLLGFSTYEGMVTAASNW